MGALVVIGLAIGFANAGSDTGGSIDTFVPDAPTNSTVRVTYKLTGSASGADLTYTDGTGNIQQQAGIRVPLRAKNGGEGLSFTGHSGDFVQFSAQNTGDAGDLECEIAADGATINRGRSSGAYTIVSCSVTLP